MANEPTAAKELLDFIGQFEAPRGYVDYYRGASFPPPKPLTSMTINEVRAWQKAANPPGPGTAAAGKYQIVNYKSAPTMDELVKELGLSGDELYDEQVQDAMGMALLKRAGMHKFQDGKISAEKFGQGVAKVWASMPKVIGVNPVSSYYDKDGLNKSHTTSANLLSKISPVKAYAGRVDQSPVPSPRGVAPTSAEGPTDIATAEAAAPTGVAPTYDPAPEGVTSASTPAPSVVAPSLAAPKINIDLPEVAEDATTASRTELAEDSTSDRTNVVMDALESAGISAAAISVVADAANSDSSVGIAMRESADWQPEPWKLGKVEVRPLTDGFKEEGEDTLQEATPAGEQTTGRRDRGSFVTKAEELALKEQPDATVDVEAPWYMPSQERASRNRQLAVDAMRGENLLWAALSSVGADRYAYDPDFELTDDVWAKTDHLPVQYIDMFEGVNSQEHFDAILESANEIQAGERRLQEAGWEGIGLRLTAALLDPVGVGLSVAAAPVGGALKIGQAGRIASAALAGGTSNLAMEAALQNYNPNVTDQDLVIAGVLGTALGGAVGAMTRGGTQLDADFSAVARQAFEDPSLVGRGESTLGAAQVAGAPKARTPAEQMLDAAADAPRTAFGKVRWDMVGRLKSSDHPAIRKIGGLIASDGVGNADGSVSAITATERQTTTFRQFGSKFQRSIRPGFTAFKKEAGNAKIGRDVFNERVSRAIRNGADSDTSTAINKVANDIRTLHGEVLSYMKKANVKGFEEIPENPDYLLRMWNRSKIEKFVADNSHGTLVTLIRRSMPSMDELDDEVGLRVAGAFAKSIGGQRGSRIQDMNRALSGENQELLEELLIESGLDASEAVRIAKLTSRDANIGKIGRAKRRLEIDEKFSMNIGGKTVSLQDLMENDIELLIPTYLRQVTGSAEATRFRAEFTPVKADGEMGEIPSIDAIMTWVEQTAPAGTKGLRGDMDRIKLIHDVLEGKPLYKQTKFTEALRYLGGFNFIRAMNQTGIPMMAEFGGVLSTGTWRTLLQHGPALRGIYRRAADGKLSDELAHELEMATGLATEHLRRSTVNRFDDMGVFESSAMNRVDRALEKGKQITANISLMTPINTAFHRMTNRLAAQRFVDLAYGQGRQLSTKRLNAMGLDDATLARIKSEIRTHAVTEDGVLGKKLVSLRISDWSDPDLAQAFGDAVTRHTRSAVQENDIGNMTMWMTTPLGQTVMQFKSFINVAYTKQLLNGLHHRDWETFVKFSLSTLFAGMAYTGRTYLNSIGDDEATKRLEDDLSMQRVGMQAFAWASYASIIPSAADTAAGLVGEDPIFGYGRAENVVTDWYAGIASVNTLGRAAQVISDVTGEASNNAASNATGLLPFQNAMGIKQMLNWLTD